MYVVAATREVEDAQPTDGQHSKAIGNIPIEKLALTELQAAVDRSRSCLASRRSHVSPSAAAGGYF